MTDWQKVLDEHGRAVWLTAYRLLGNPDDAEDVLQETFLGIWQFSRNRPIRNWGAFLRCRATSRALDRLRKRKRRQEVTAGSEKWAKFPADCPEPLELAEKSELADLLREALAQLPTQQAEAFCLCCLEGMKYQEVAKAMKVKLNTVGVLVHRARARLRRFLRSILNENRWELGHEL